MRVYCTYLPAPPPACPPAPRRSPPAPIRAGTVGQIIFFRYGRSEHNKAKAPIKKTDRQTLSARHTQSETEQWGRAWGTTLRGRQEGVRAIHRQRMKATLADSSKRSDSGVRVKTRTHVPQRLVEDVRVRLVAGILAVGQAVATLMGLDGQGKHQHQCRQYRPARSCGP